MQTISRRRFLSRTASLFASSTIIYHGSTPAISAEPIWYDALEPIVDDPVKKILQLYGSDLKIDQRLIPTDRTILIRADTVTIYGPIKTQGNDITIVARHILAGPDAELDTRGLMGKPDFTSLPPAPNGTDPGESGVTGKSGGNGSRGGNVTLLAETIEGNLSINSSGGDGGKAQSGGTGARGRKGPDNPEIGSTGGDGGPGGFAGRAGKPGEGGEPGIVNVGTVNVLRPGTISIKASYGRGGASGLHGSPGPGGPPGTGASGEFTWPPPHKNSCKPYPSICNK